MDSERAMFAGKNSIIAIAIIENMHILDVCFFTFIDSLYGNGNNRILLFLLLLKLLRHGGFIGTAYAGRTGIGLPMMAEPVCKELQIVFIM